MGALRFGIIGMGRHGSRYARHILEDVKGAYLAAVCRREREPISEFLVSNPEINYHDEYGSLLNDDIDAVIIATPTAFHEEMAVEAMNAGLDVILEKPMAGTVDACERIIDTEQKTGRKLMIAQTLRYCPVWKGMKALMKEIPFPEWFEMVQYLEPPKTPWLLDRDLAQGGCTLNTGAHVFDSFRFIFGSSIKRIECTMERSLNPVWEDFAYGNVYLEGGLEGSFKIARDSKYRSRTMRIDHQDGLLYGDSLETRLVRIEDGVERTLDVGGPVNTIIPLLEDFIECMKKDSESPISSADGMEAVKVARACYVSSEKGAEVRV